MYLNNPTTGPMLSLKIAGIIPFPLVLSPGESMEIDDKHLQVLQPYVTSFKLSVTKGKPEPVPSEEVTINEPAPELAPEPVPSEEVTINEPAPEPVPSEEVTINEPAPAKPAKKSTINRSKGKPAGRAKLDK